MDEDEEIIVKAMTDYWVVGKKSDQRELYVILNQKNANLIEVNGMSPPPGDVHVTPTALHISALILYPYFFTNTLFSFLFCFFLFFLHYRGG